jgi:hypothetical protein
MWKRHAIYESRPCSVIVTLGGHLYRIPEVVPTTVPPKQCRKVVSHTTKFKASSQSVQKVNIRTLQPLQPQSKHLLSNRSRSKRLKQSTRIPSAHKSSHVARLVKKVQPFQPQVHDNLQQAKQRNFSSKASNSSRCRFNKRFSLSPGHSTQWRPFLPKEGGLIQVDIGGHPPIPTGSKQSSGNLLFLAVFRFLNFWGHFEGLNEGFSGSSTSMITKGFD